MEKLIISDGGGGIICYETGLKERGPSPTLCMTKSGHIHFRKLTI